MKSFNAVTVVALLASAGTVSAAELPKSGNFSTRFYAHNVQMIAELDTANGMKSYVNEAFEFFQSQNPNDLFAKTSVRCLGYGRYHPEKGAVREDGTCTSFDADGDKIFFDYVVDLKDSSDTSSANGRLLGGSGKYEGITGTFTNTIEMLQPLGTGQTMWAGDVKGEYKIGP